MSAKRAEAADDHRAARRAAVVQRHGRELVPLHALRFTPSADYNRQLTRAQQRALPRLLWHDAHFRSVRLWIHPDDFLPTPNAQNIAPYVDGWIATHKRARPG